MEKLPKITIVIPTYNEEVNIERALRSIFSQKYPKHLLEVFVVDDNSEDKTVEIAKKFPVEILLNGAHDGEVGKMIGLRKATGDLFYYFDADMELIGTEWFSKMVHPLMTDPTITGVVTRNYARKTAPSLERYFAMDPIHRDPIYEMFSPSIESTIVEKREKYFVCKYAFNKIPPAARNMYRIAELKTIVKDDKKFMELEILSRFVKKGQCYFGYVPIPGKYHHHAKNVMQLLKKRKRNVQKVYLPTVAKREYTWFDLRNPKDIVKILLLIAYANTFIVSFLRGIYKSIKHKDIAGMWEPIIAFVVTDTIILSFLSSKKGLAFIKNTFR